MRDFAATYLQLLQVGYRINEFNYSSDGSGDYQEFVKFNPSRVMIYLYTEISGGANIGYKMPSGLFIPINNSSTPLTQIITVSLHYAAPSLPIGCINTSVGSVGKGFEIVKE
jgi:hypothetical protein